MNIEIKVDTATVASAIAAAGEKAPQAIARAINRGADSGRVAMARAIAADTGLPVRVVQSEIKIQYATPNSQVARISIAGRRLPLISFQARGPEPSRGRGKGVSYRLPTGRGRQPNAFIATMPTGHRGVFKRTGGARLPIAELFGPSLPHVFHKFLGVLEDRAKEALLTNLKSELKFAMGR